MNEDLKQRFVGEAWDLIENLEREILGLEKNPNNIKGIQETFRVMHTLKGTAAMFGFNLIGEITHHLETIYSEIRSERLSVNDNIVTLTFDTIDILKTLLEKREKLTKKEKINYDRLLKRVIDVCQAKTESITFRECCKEEVPESQQPVSDEDSKLSLFYIIYRPDRNVFIRGADPYSVFHDLENSGKIHCMPELTDNELQNYKPTDHFSKKWEIFFHSADPKIDMNYVFMFFTEEEYQVIPIHPLRIKTNKVFVKKYLKSHPEDKELKKVEEILDQFDLTSQITEYHHVDANMVNNEPGNDESNDSGGNIQHEHISSIKVPAKKLDELINLVGELVITNSHLSYLSEHLNNIAIRKAISHVEKLSKNLRDNTLELRLIPISLLTTNFQRLIRDLSKKLEKQIEFVAEGTDTELDSNIINSLDAPLMHIIRNGIDHGIESPAERIKVKKSPAGIIRLSAYYSGTNVFISVQDDGRGIDNDYILKKAVKQGIINSGAKLTEKEIYNLIFIPGFSTAENLTEISGRGVGMDVVKKSITDLRGEIEIDSEKGLGTTITLKLPLTLSIIDTMHVQINQRPYLIPLNLIESCHKECHVTLFKDQNKRIEYHNELIPFLYLREELQLGGQPPEIDNLIIINRNEKNYALVVDKVIGEHQAVVKPINYLNKSREYFSGASMLGNGQLALILDINNLLNKTRESLVYI